MPAPCARQAKRLLVDAKYACAAKPCKSLRHNGLFHQHAAASSSRPWDLLLLRRCKYWAERTSSLMFCNCRS